VADAQPDTRDGREWATEWVRRYRARLPVGRCRAPTHEEGVLCKGDLTGEPPDPHRGITYYTSRCQVCRVVYTDPIPDGPTSTTPVQEIL
jgi:hypothetical protein